MGWQQSYEVEQMEMPSRAPGEYPQAPGQAEGDQMENNLAGKTWWTPGGPWASDEPSWQKQPVASWAVLGRLPVGHC